MRGNEDRKVAAFEPGANDDITKPFHLGEPSARLLAVVRRDKPFESGLVATVVGDVQLVVRAT